jgi:cytochrome c553
MRFSPAFGAVALTLLATFAPAADTPSFSPADAARGKRLAATCIACHGVADMKLGSPSVTVPMLAGQRPEAIFLALRDYKSGVRTNQIMAALVAPLSDKDMRDLGAYLSDGGPQMPKTHGAGSWAHQKVRRDCTACHGESGMGVMPGIPVLTGQHPDYLIDALNAYRDGRRTNPTMQGVAKKLSDDEIRQLAEYFSKQAHLRVSK